MKVYSFSFFLTFQTVEVLVSLESKSYCDGDEDDGCYYGGWDENWTYENL